MANIAHAFPLLPAELTSMVADAIRDNFISSCRSRGISPFDSRYDLSRASLVCRRWHAHLTPALWRNLVLRSRADLRELVALVSRPGCTLGGCIRCIQLVDSDGEPWACAATALLPSLAARLPHLKVLDWNHTRLPDAEARRSAPFPVAASAHVAGFTSVASLVLYHCSFASWQALVRFVHALPLLESLQCNFVRWKESCSGQRVARCVKRCSRLQHVSGRACTSSAALIGLFPTSPCAVQVAGFPMIKAGDLAALTALIELSPALHRSMDEWSFRRTERNIYITRGRADIVEVDMERIADTCTEKMYLSSVVSGLRIVVVSPDHAENQRYMKSHGILGWDDTDWKSIDEILQSFTHLQYFHVLMTVHHITFGSFTTPSDTPFHPTEVPRTLAGQMPVAYRTGRLIVSSQWIAGEESRDAERRASAPQPYMYGHDHFIVPRIASLPATIDADEQSVSCGWGPVAIRHEDWAFAWEEQLSGEDHWTAVQFEGNGLERDWLDMAYGMPAGL